MAVGGQKRRRTGAAEADEVNEEQEASAVQTSMRPMEEERGKAMSTRMMREREMGKEIRRNFQIFIDLVILPEQILPGYRGALRVQGCLSHMTYCVEPLHLPTNYVIRLRVER